MVSTIFINYRREDSISTAGRLYDRLAQAFGQKDVFMDVDHIPAGVDFVAHLDSQIAACDVILVIIGKAWLNARDDSGQRRLDKPDDFVAIEIAAALARNIRVVPVLVDGAEMPRASELPDGLKPLARRQAIELRQNQFGRDVDALMERLREVVGDRTRRLTRRRFRRLAAVMGIAVLLAAAAGGYRLFRNAATATATNAGGPSEQGQQGRTGAPPDQPKRAEAAIAKPAPPTPAPSQASPQPPPVGPEQPRPAPTKRAEADAAKPASPTPTQASPQPATATPEQSRPAPTKRAEADAAKPASPTPTQASPQPAPVGPEQPRPAPTKRAEADAAKPASATPVPPQASAQAVPVAPEPHPSPVAPRGWLGVRIQAVTSDLASSLDLTSSEGALLVELDDMGPAAFGELQRGDIIVRFDGREVKDPRSLAHIIAETPPGKRAEIIVNRRGKQETHLVTIGRLPEATDTAGGQSQAAGAPGSASSAQTTLGLEINAMTSELRKKFNLKDTVHGVVVTAVDPGGAAAEKQVAPGAVIVELQWRRVTDPAQFKTGLEQLKLQGKSNALLLVSDGAGQKRYITLRIN